MRRGAHRGPRRRDLSARHVRAIVAQALGTGLLLASCAVAGAWLDDRAARPWPERAPYALPFTVLEPPPACPEVVTSDVTGAAAGGVAGAVAGCDVLVRQLADTQDGATP